IYDSQKIRLKRRLLEGAIGRIERVSVLGCWPRPTTYYGRNAWAGRARVESDWILDSRVNNAMAHIVNLAAFLAGPEMDRSIEPERLEAELYRAYPIENFDTASLRVEAAGGVSLLVLMTHACSRTIDPTIVLHGTSGCCRLQTAQGGTL